MNHSESQAMSRERKRRTVSGIVCDPMNRPPAIARKRPESRFPAWKQFGLDALRSVVQWYRENALVLRDLVNSRVHGRRKLSQERRCWTGTTGAAFSVAKRQAGVLTDGLALRACRPVAVLQSDTTVLETVVSGLGGGIRPTLRFLPEGFPATTVV